MSLRRHYAKGGTLTRQGRLHRFQFEPEILESIMATLAVTDDTFDAEVKNSDIPVVVDFWAEWCGPCKQIGPSLEELSNEMDGKVKIVKVNVDDNPNSPAQMGVRGIPALFIFKDGQVVSNMAGARPKAALQSWIEDSI